MSSSSDAPRPLFLVWLRDFAHRPRPRLKFEADEKGEAPVLTADEQKAFVRASPIADDVAHLPLDKLALLYPWREAA